MRSVRTFTLGAAALGIGLLTVGAKADSVIPNPPTVTGSAGNYHYSYNVRLDNTSIVDGTRGTLQLFDVAGYKAGSLVTTQLATPTGGTGAFVGAASAGSGAGLTNFTFTYTGTGFVQGPKDSVANGFLFNFKFDDLYNVGTSGDEVAYTGKDMSGGRKNQTNEGFVAGPAANIPEPAFYQLGSLLVLGGAGSVFGLRKRRKA